MGLGVWGKIFALFGRDDETGEDPGQEDDEGRFVPSPLDVSVRIGHGGSDGNGTRELSEMSERARELEESRRGN